MNYNILLSAHYLQRDFERYRHIFEEKNISVYMPPVKERLSEEELLPIIGEYHGIICGDDKLTARVLDEAKKLKVIVKWGTGIDSIDKEYAERRGIPVYNTPGAFTDPVADLIMGFILVFARGIKTSDDLLKANRWEKVGGHALFEKTLGIIGVGNIGTAVAKRAAGFGMQILGNDIREISEQAQKEFGITMLSKEEVVRRADYLATTCNLNSTSYHILGRKEFDTMDRKPVVVNAARGPLIDEHELIEALEKKTISGAALDVFEEEPLPEDSPLRFFPNVLLSAHNANASPSCYMRVHENSIKKLFEGLELSYE